MNAFKRSKQDIHFSIIGNDNYKHARTKAIRYSLAFGWVLVAGLIVVKLVISLLIGA